MTKVEDVSDRLAISAAFSVLVMSAFVLFGPHANTSEFAPSALRAQPGLVAPASVSVAEALLPAIR